MVTSTCEAISTARKCCARGEPDRRTGRGRALDPDYPRIDGVCQKAPVTSSSPSSRTATRRADTLYSGRIVEFYERLFGEPVRHYDFTWLRAIGPGKAPTALRPPYMGRGTTAT